MTALRLRTPGSGGANTILVLGGARSGKSAYAERLILDSAQTAIYLATATAGDGEMTERIAQHRARRGRAWHTIEEPIRVQSVLARHGRADRPILVDCLTLWLSNLMHAQENVDWHTGWLTDFLPRLPGPVVFVSNEVGLGIVPDNALAREFRDHAGRMNQAIAAAVDAVVFMAAGLPLQMKPR